MVALTQCSIVLAARFVDKLYVNDPYWLVARYSDPWRTAAVAGVVLLALAVSVRAARAELPLSWPRFFATVAALVFGLAICLELTTAVHFNDALGDLYVHTLVFRRAKISLGSEKCVRADFTSPFAWRLNGVSLHPRLLPLPYESNAVVNRLSCSGTRSKLRKF